MPIIEDLLRGQSLPIGTPHALVLSPCPPHRWERESRVGRMGIYEVFSCSVCAAGDPEAEGLHEAVRECVDDR